MTFSSDRSATRISTDIALRPASGSSVIVTGVPVCANGEVLRADVKRMTM
jgi:hypothetical protein